jgi:P-type Ca2+ transporter type 2C
VWVINFRQFFDEDGSFSVKRCLYYLKIAVALAVAAIPEGLPAVITTCLALGTRRMAQKNAIVRKLPSVETLGCTTVICSDKTGTLTTNEMSVVKLMYSRKGKLVQHTVTGTTYSPTEGVIESGGEDVGKLQGVAQLAQAASLCNDACIKYEEGKFRRIGEPTEAALKVLVEKIGVPGKEKPTSKNAAANAASEHWAAQLKRVALLEFSRDRKSMSVLCQQSGSRRNTLFVKGAPESLLARCSRVQEADGFVVDMTSAAREAILKENDGLAKQALRCLAIAVKTDDLGELQDYDGSESHRGHARLQDSNQFEGIESGLTFLGIVGIKDPARPEVNDAIANCVQAGIRVIVITGDNKSTAESICRNIGIFSETESLEGKSFTGRDFLALSEEEQLKHLFSDGRGRVFSRCVSSLSVVFAVVF